MCVCVCVCARAPTALSVILFQIHSDQKQFIYFQSFNDTYVASTLQYHFIITRMSRL